MHTPLWASPITINKLQLRNRIVFPPMSTKFAALDGTVTERLLNYYEARAAGGAGLVVVEATYIHPSGNSFSRGLGLASDSAIPGLKRLTRTLKKHGAAVSIQLQHGGRAANAQATGRAVLLVSSLPGITPYDDGRVMDRADMEELAASWARSAQRAMEAGFDAIEMHGAHGYLLSQFLSPYTNRREDEYGGSAENRMRFPLEVMRAVRAAVGPNFPVGWRMSAVEGMAAGIPLEESLELSRRLVAEGVDSLHVSVGLRETNFMVSPPSCVPKGWNAPLARAVKESIQSAVPVIVAGQITDEDVAEEILQRGDADMVTMGRALIADPALPAKVLAGRKHSIIRCISCNEGCVGGSARGTGIACALNPLTGLEGKYDLGPAAAPRKVAVIGGGPAGMEAALGAARRGHKVELYEQGPALGGLLALAQVPPHKEGLALIPAYYGHALAEAGVSVHLNRRMDAEAVKALGADVILLATGSVPVMPAFCKAAPQAMTADAVLSGRAKAGERVLLIGGGLIGCECAEYLAAQGKAVTVLEMLPEAAKDMETRTRRYLMLRLKDYAVDMRTGTQVLEILPENGGCKVRVKSPLGLEEELGGFDTLIVAVGYRPENSLALELERAGLPCVRIGDCASVGKIMSVVHGGFAAALKI